MTTELDTTRRLRAWHEGRPQPRGEALNVHVGDDDDILCLSFVRMGGESLPWGVILGGATASEGKNRKPSSKSGSTPRVFTVPDPRNRDLVADMMIAVGREVLAHFGHPRYCPDQDESLSVYRFRQLWMPNPSHLEMLHSLAFAYARTRWERPDVEVLRDFGLLANCLFVESQRPGQQTVVVASSALSSVYSFPTSPVREAHLGHQLAWFGRERTRVTRLDAARAAEKFPVATALDPDFERKSLAPLVDKWNDAPRPDRVRLGKSHASAITKILRAELERRHDLVVDAIGLLRRDTRRPNSGLRDLVRIGRESFSKIWWDNVLKSMADDPDAPAYWPGLWGDVTAGSAAFAYHSRSAAAAEARQILVHGDRALQEEELLAGHGLRITVTGIAGRGSTWNASFDFPEIPSLKSGGSLSIAGAATHSSKSSLKILDFDLDARTIVLQPKWTAARSALGALGMSSDDQRWVGKVLVLVDDFPPDLPARLAGRAAKRSAHDFDPLALFKRERDPEPQEPADT